MLAFAPPALAAPEAEEPADAPEVPPKAEQSAVPKPELPAPTRIRFVADPVSDGAVLSLAFGIAAFSEIIMSTGEITPQQPQPKGNLLSLDRNVIERSPDAAWGTVSNIGIGVALSYAAIHPILSGYGHGVEAGIVDAVIYAETISVTWALTNLTKISFRRPRPSAYQDQERLNPGGGTENPVALSDTNSALSFFSGHSSITASVSAAATYLAFARSPNTARPWLTLGAGTALTTMVAYGRVRAGDHFPTDVIAGAMVGAGIGVLVPHLHIEAPAKRRPVWIGFNVVPNGFAVGATGTLL